MHKVSRHCDCMPVLFRFLDARYEWTFDCLLQSHQKHHTAQHTASEPAQFVQYVTTASARYSDALTRQIRRMRLNQHQARMNSGDGGMLETISVQCSRCKFLTASLPTFCQGQYDTHVSHKQQLQEVEALTRQVIPFIQSSA